MANDKKNGESAIILPPSHFALEESPAAKTPKATKKRKEIPITAVFDYRSDQIPNRIRDLISAHLVIESEDAKKAGALGFMARSLAIATLPHRRHETPVYRRKNGDFTLTMMTSHEEGLPYGTAPRLLLNWVCTEAVRTQQRELQLGATMTEYLQELGLSRSGGQRGDITRLKHAITTLFSTTISCHHAGADSFRMTNILLADGLEWWQPQKPEDAGKWESTVKLSQPFFDECIEHPIPIDTRAIKALQGSPLAMDLYTWLTYRMSYLSRRTTIPWMSLAAQLGSSYSFDTEQGVRDFKRALLRQLKNVVAVYPEARLSESDYGLVLYPSPTHVPLVGSKPRPTQKNLPL